MEIGFPTAPHAQLNPTPNPVTPLADQTAERENEG